MHWSSPLGHILCTTSTTPFPCVQQARPVSTLDQLDPDAPSGKGFFPEVPQATKDAYERKFVRYLASLFLVILTIGLAVAASGFLPDAVDDFILKFVFPTFTPLVGAFLLAATLYGLYKSREDPDIMI